MMLMRRAMLMLAGALALSGCAGGPSTQAEQQTLVDRSAITVQEILTEGNANMLAENRGNARRARAALVCPQLFRASFLIGAQGGSCVLVARDGAGSWSSPTFYTMSTGSLGLQVGIQDMQILMLVMNDRALQAILDSQFKFGADASIAVATVGGGIAGATTANAGADIVAYARARGLYLGVSLEGSLLSADSAGTRAYYGRDVSPREVVVGMAAHNPGADPLRLALTQHGSGAALAPASPSPAVPAGYGTSAGGAYAAPVGSGGVSSQPLSPLR